MASFIVLGNWTDQGIRNIKAAPERIHPMRSMVEKANGKMQLYYTLGTYDFVMIIEVQNDETILEILRSLGGMGNVRTATMKAWTESELGTILK